MTARHIVCLLVFLVFVGLYLQLLHFARDNFGYVGIVIVGLLVLGALLSLAKLTGDSPRS
jgi:hypothetical protein